MELFLFLPLIFPHRTSIYANHAAHEEFVSTSSHMDADFNSKVNETLAALNGNLVLAMNFILLMITFQSSFLQQKTFQWSFQNS